MVYDYIIVGAGTAGCVLADRLTEDGKASVLLIEAGGPDTHPLIHIPAGFLRLLDHPRLTWRYRTAPDAATGNRAMLFPRGKGLGGSSSINGLLYVRGQPEDYDQWAQLGNAGWGWEDVLPFFRRSERWEGGDTPLRGSSGPLTVSRMIEPPELCERIIEAAREVGLKFRDDINCHPHEGIGYYQQTRRGRFRASAARSFLARGAKRPNLRILTNVTVGRILLEGRRAVGVDLVHNSGRGEHVRAAREVILSAGVIGSPQILQLSGIGEPDGLKRLGIDVAHALSGVGENLQDHYVVRSTYRMRTPTLNQRAAGLPLLYEMMKYVVAGSGVLTYGAALLGAFVRTQANSATPDVQYVIAPGSFRAGRLGELDDFPGMTCGWWQMRPHSRGSVTVASRDPRDAPVIQPRYLSDAIDRQIVVDGMRFARRLCGAQALASYRDREILPGPDVRSDEEMLDYARQNGSTVYHAVGTCRMGSDRHAVVDASLRVHGVGGLRVVDASIMPTITSTNTNATTLMIAEKAAAMIVADRSAGKAAA